MSEAVNHPDHYGGEDDPYEAIKVIEAWGLGFHLGNCVKYGRKGDAIEDLKKARWYLQRKIDLMEQRKADLAERDNDLAGGGEYAAEPVRFDLGEPADADLLDDAALVIARTARPGSLLDWFRTAMLGRMLIEYARRLRG